MADVLNTSYIFASFLVSRISNVNLKHSLKTQTEPTFLLSLAPFNSYLWPNSIKIDMSFEILQSEWCLRTPESECLFEKTLSHTHSSLWVDFLSSPPFLLFAFTSCQIHRHPFKGGRLNMTIIFTFSRGRSHDVHHSTENRQSPSQSLEVDAIATDQSESIVHKEFIASNKQFCCNKRIKRNKFWRQIYFWSLVDVE